MRRVWQSFCARMFAESGSCSGPAGHPPHRPRSRHADVDEQFVQSSHPNPPGAPLAQGSPVLPLLISSQVRTGLGVLAS